MAKESLDRSSRIKNGTSKGFVCRYQCFLSSLQKVPASALRTLFQDFTCRLIMFACDGKWRRLSKTKPSIIELSTVGICMPSVDISSFSFISRGTNDLVEHNVRLDIWRK